MDNVFYGEFLMSGALQSGTPAILIAVSSPLTIYVIATEKRNV